MAVNSEFDYQLSKLAEECGELTQIAMKTLIFGVDSINPNTGESNRDLMKKEIGDVLAGIQTISSALGIQIDQDYIKQRQDELQLSYVMSKVK